MTKTIEMNPQFNANRATTNNHNFMANFVLIAKNIKCHCCFFYTRNLWHDLFSANSHNHCVRIKRINCFRCCFGVIDNSDIYTFLNLTFQIFMEKFHFFLKPHNIRKQRLTTQSVRLFIEDDLMSTICATDSSLHSCNAAANYSNLFLTICWSDNTFLCTLELHRIYHTMTVITWMGKQMQIFGNRYTASMVHAIVATQTWANVIFTSFLCFFDNVWIRHR